MTAAQEWLEAPHLVEVRRARRIAADPDAVVAAVTNDLAFAQPGAAMAFPVPGTDPELTCWVLQSGRTSTIEVTLGMASGDPYTRSWINAASGVRTTVSVERARGGSRARLSLSAQVQRQHARDLRGHLEAVAGQALSRLTAVATGFAAPASPRVEDVRRPVRALGEASANIPASRVMAATPAAIWDVLTAETALKDGRRFWVTPGPPAVGHWLCVLRQGAQGTLYEVLSWRPERELALAGLAGVHHPAITVWSLSPVTGGTEVTLNHRCATSHVGLQWDITSELDRVGGVVET